jgi:hypothetical protein
MSRQRGQLSMESVGRSALILTGGQAAVQVPALATLVVVTLIGLGTYLVAATRLGIEEPRVLVQGTLARLTRRGRLGKQP